MSFEKSLVLHCSPTLASIKIANLFGFTYETEEELDQNIEYWNRQMETKGICLSVMRRGNGKALIYVYRRSELEKILQNSESQNFLDRYGYRGLNLEETVSRLRWRLNIREDFPHEVGIFLGYPLEDVEGFIQNEGKNFLFSGLWKVYDKPEERKKLFGKFKKCTEIYVRMWNNGRSIQQLTVAA